MTPNHDAMALTRPPPPRDLHEALAARLMSGLGLDDAALLRGVIRDALAQLRDIVTAAPAAAPLDDVLADCRSEMGERLDAAGIALDWRLGDWHGSLGWREAALLRRLLRDFSGTALDRPGVSRVRVLARIVDARLHLDCSDNAARGPTVSFAAISSAIAAAGGTLRIGAGCLALALPVEAA